MSGKIKMPKMKITKPKKQTKPIEEEKLEEETEINPNDDKTIDELIGEIINKKMEIKDFRLELKDLILDLRDLEEKLYSKVGEAK